MTPLSQQCQRQPLMSPSDHSWQCVKLSQGLAPWILREALKHDQPCLSGREGRPHPLPSTPGAFEADRWFSSYQGNGRGLGLPQTPRRGHSLPGQGSTLLRSHSYRRTVLLWAPWGARPWGDHRRLCVSPGPREPSTRFIGTWPQMASRTLEPLLATSPEG